MSGSWLSTDIGLVFVVWELNEAAVWIVRSWWLSQSPAEGLRQKRFRNWFSHELDPNAWEALLQELLMLEEKFYIKHK